ncbi:hypothetical protein ACTFIR_011224 [Dictyostelium discoideum]
MAHHAPTDKTGQGVSQIIINTQIKTTTKTINERIISSEWIISKTQFKCTTIYAPAKSNERYTWYKENLTEELLHSDIITGDFNVDCSADNNLNKHIKTIFDEFQFTELRNGITFPRNKSTIDRVFVSKKILHLNPIVTTKEIKLKSDHNMVIIELKIPEYEQQKKGERLWRQNLETLKMNSTSLKINKTIKYYNKKFEENTSKWHKLDICEQWLKLKNEIKKQSINIEIRESNKTKNKLKSLSDKLETAKNSRAIFLKEEINNILKEQARIKQANQTNTHINNKETPSKYLTRRLKVQRKTNEIPQILDPSNNCLVTKNEEILEIARRYYDNLYQKRECNEEIHHELLKTFNKRIDQKILDEINQPIEEYEIRLGIEKIQEGKAPGKDGLLPTFYKNHINEILPTISKLYNHFWNKSIPKDFKQGILITIYKNKGDPNNLDNYRPITLLNADYKIYSKIINNRILKFLNKVISPFQTGFVPRRLLHDNIITLNSTIEIIKRQVNTKEDIEPIITFYDFEKAFDSISHNAILRTLAHLKLPLKMVLTIMNLLNESETSVYINNSLSKSFISKRGTKQGDPISPTIFALVVECMATTIINDHCIKGVTKEAIKILQFADDTATTAYNFMDHFLMNEWIKKFCQATSAKINQSKCSCITFKWNTRTLYTVIKSNERYLGFDFNNKGIKSKINIISDNIRAKLVTWNSTSSTYMGRLIMAKTYALSQLTFHTYINTTSQHNSIENEIVKFVFNTKSKNSLSLQRRQNNYTNGGLNLWSLKTRELAQKAWIFERYLHQSVNNTPSSYIKLWEEELKNNNNNNNNNTTTNQIQLHWQYMMTIKSPEHNKFIPTPGQKEIMTKINSKHLPFKEIKKIINMKGRDLLWRYTLKALPKIYNAPCQQCGGDETSEHIFFDCKAHIKNTQEIFNFILTKCGHTQHTWNVKVLNQLQIALIANLIAIIFEKIWHKRNTLIHDEKEIIIHRQQVIRELIKTQRAAWERTQSVINKILRFKSKQRSEDKNKSDSLISLKLLQFSRQWNSPLHSITLPKHLKKYNNSISNLYKQ